MLKRSVAVRPKLSDEIGRYIAERQRRSGHVMPAVVTDHELEEDLTRRRSLPDELRN
jgi:hypothetical protein